MAGLLDEWDRAVARGDRDRMSDLLQKVDLKDVEMILDSVLANPNRHGSQLTPRSRSDRSRRSPAHETKLATRDLIARLVGFCVGVGTAVLFVTNSSHRPFRGPALVEVSPTAAWLVVALSTVAYFLLVRRVETDFLWKYWATLFVGVLAAVNVIRLLVLAF